jgi:hypothetical protein
MPIYQPGEVIRDCGGYEVIVHFVEGSSQVAPFTTDAFRDWLKGKLTMEDYLDISANHLATAHAYDRGVELPEGATVTQEHVSLYGDVTPSSH